VVWLLVGMALLVIAVRTLSMLKLSAVITLCSVALIGALTPEAFLHLLIGKVSTLFPRVVQSGAAVISKELSPNSTQVLSSDVFSNIGHFVIFTSLGLFGGLNGQKFGYLFAGLAVAVFAIITEVLQLLVARRTASLDDLLIDLSGALIGLIIGCMFFWSYKVSVK